MTRHRFEASRAPRDLRRGARVVAGARTARDGRAVRLGPRDLLGPGPTRVGRFARVDPLATPRVWGLWEWVGFLFWAGVTAEAGRRAWKRHGGLPQPGDTTARPDRQRAWGGLEGVRYPARPHPPAG